MSIQFGLVFQINREEDDTEQWCILGKDMKQTIIISLLLFLSLLHLFRF